MSSMFQPLNKNDECLPIKVLEDLQSWEPSKAEKHKVQPLQKRMHSADLPKTLLCHDMKGGYLDDRFINGTANDNNFYFIHWSMIDIFVYFSHHLVTIPPCSWITAAHRNGVKILGTFITEWDAGIAICNNIFNDTDTVQNYCMQLVKIAECFQFDGWLINIENKLNITQVPFLQEFVRFLTLKMHEAKEGSLVIWYDSIIETGELKWQNALNQHNRDFFFVCDGIFLNYNWTHDTLQASVKEAGARKTDVFVGVDVFGRGCLGGGGFSTNIAVAAARDFNLSVAIFAPGWVFETLDVEDFKTNQYKFWDTLVELCAPRVITGLPYYSSFCPGFGQKLYRHGKVEHLQPWFNLSLQQPQPSFHFTNCPTSSASITFHTEDAFNGGGCLKLTAGMPQDKNMFEIVSTNFHIRTNCVISYTVKPCCDNLEVALVLGISDGLKFYQLELSDRPNIQNDAKFSCICSSCASLQEYSINAASSKIIKCDDGQSWIKRKYRVHCHYNKECFIKKIQLLISNENMQAAEFSVLLGELSIMPFSDASTFYYKDLNVTQKDGSTVEVECILEWHLDTCIDFSDLCVYIDGTRHFICTTSQFYYMFKGCFSSEADVEFFLIPRCLGKTLQPLFIKLCLDD